MKLIGLMLVRNEEWCLGLTARAALMWCDELIILDHASTDATQDILRDLRKEFTDFERDYPYDGRITWVHEKDPTWAEMAHRQRLLELARARGATHLGLIDADELLTANMLPFIRNAISGLHPRKVLQLPWLCLRDDIHHVHATGQWSEANVSTAVVDNPQLHWTARNGYDFHHRNPMGMPYIPQEIPRADQRNFGLMHLQFVSARRLKAKQFLYQLTERLRWPDRSTAQEVAAMYGRTVRESQAAKVTEVPGDWWDGYAHLMQYLDVNAEPWQEKACAEILREHPGIEKGLDNFGLNL